MTDKRIKISNIVRNQLPEYVQEEYPLVTEFLSQYYISQEYQGSPVDLIQNIDQYVKVDSFSDVSENNIILKDSISFADDIITIDLNLSPTGTSGFPRSYGLIQIDDEIITYTGITSTSFTGCIRGFCGVTSYEKENSSDELVFNTSESASHSSGTKITNLSSLFLKEFLKKAKTQLLPGFESRDIYPPVKESLFIKQAKDFYSTKGTDKSFKILFGSLYGEYVSVIKPKDYLFKPSDAHYRVVNDFVVEALEGDPLNLIDSTLNQDPYQNYTKAYAPVTNVEKIITPSGEVYYTLSIDAGYSRDIIADGALYGAFSIHPKTRVIENHPTNSQTVTVDSTIGFPDSGELYVSFSDNTAGIVSYTSKSITQFYECSGVTGEIKDSSFVYINSFAYGSSIENPDEIIKIRINSTINDLSIEGTSDNFYNVEGYDIAIKTLGTDSADKVSNNWFFNISPTYEVGEYNISGNTIVIITTKSKNTIRKGDSVEIKRSDSSLYSAVVTLINNEKEFQISIPDTNIFSSNYEYKVRRKLTKVNANNYPELSDVVSDVQNVYKVGSSTYVTSNSIPSGNLECSDLSISATFTAEDQYTFSTSKVHPFATGDIIYYTPDSNVNKLVDEGIYYVKKISNTQLKLTKGNSHIYFSEVTPNSPKYISLLIDVGYTSTGKLEFFKTRSKTLKPQNLLREISTSINDRFTYETPIGKTGILKNGVEICNYKSDDRVFYGQIESIDAISTGNDYDIINPPNLTIEDFSGTGAFGYCSVEGSLEEVKVLDPGFDYITIPTIRITGGNGSGAIAEPNIKIVTHEESFSATSNVTIGPPESSIIGFSTYHKFRDREEVIYDTNGFVNVGGLSTNSSYFVSIISPTQVKLYNNLDDITPGIAISFTSYGTGVHKLRAKNRKITLGSINIVNPGSGYSNKKRTSQPSGINTALNYITINDHNYKTGEIVKYNYDGTPVSGLSTTKEYFITEINKNSFFLSEVGVGNTIRDFYYKTNQYVDLKSVGVGTHTFNYPEISVEVIGNIGVTTLGSVSKEIFKAQVEASFKGGVSSIHLENKGVGYGSSNIINFNREPNVTLNSGSGSLLKPIVKDGKIVDVIILIKGSGYNSTPQITVSGDGRGAVIYPIVENGQITSIRIIEGGVGYKKETTAITVRSNGSGVKLKTNLQTWTINLVERFKSYISSDDGFLSESINSDYQLQYTNLYCPQSLKDGNSSKHSSIIGWAYDGNPIYGPYAYSNINGTGSIVLLKSAYQLNLTENRPSNSDYPLGFFIEDYQYRSNDSSDVLDEYNGRFCVTPEFPNGTYAYFASIDNNNLPIFPYVIGNNYKSIPNSLNFNPLANQSFDLVSLGLVRNTTPYGLLDEGVSYSYLNNQNYKLGHSKVKQVSRGFIENIEIPSGGSNYKVNDRIIFDDQNTRGFGASAKVVEVGGKTVNSISVAKTSTSNVELYPNNITQSFTAVFSDPHQFKNNDVVSITGLSTTFYSINGLYQVGVTSISLALLDDVASPATTGIVTYFPIVGNLNFDVNDIFTVGTEKVKILEKDIESSRVKVLRSVSGSVGTSHSRSNILYENPRRLNFRSSSTEDFSSIKRNKEIYFIPAESLGIGTEIGIGIGKTIVFSNPGSGLKKIFVPTRTIYLKDHNLETGDKLNYNLNGGTSIGFSTNGSTSFTLTNNSTLYVAKISNDFIGVSTVRVGLGNSGEFVGVTSLTKNSSILYLTSEGVGSNHSFKTNYDSILSKISKNTVTVSAAQTHGLSNGDLVSVTVNPGISTTILVKYNDFNRRLAINPISFSSSGINTINGTIGLPNHNLRNGQKVVYNSNNPPSGFVNNGIYYVVAYDENNIRLSDSFYNSTLRTPITLSIESTSDGSISLINPPIKLYKNSTVTFDLSDSSLSYKVGQTYYSAFEFEIYDDNNFKNVSTTNIQKYGRVGIDTNAKLTLTVNENLPERLYYKLNPLTKEGNLPTIKESIEIDYSINSYNLLNLGRSEFEGTYPIVVSSGSTFTYITLNDPESSNYSSSSNIRYSTNSLSAFGPISKVQITNAGKNYYTLPKIKEIKSTLGTNAILDPSSESIGKLTKVELSNIGFDFSSDYTLKPSSYPIYTFKVEPLYYFKQIKISNPGLGYVTPPKLVVIDSVTEEIIDDLDLKFELTDAYITILKNTYQLSEIDPRIIPVENTNGIGIFSVSFNNSTKIVTITLNKEFKSEDDFPFSVGDNILVENISISDSGVGFNSKNYAYVLFEITGTNSNIGVGFGSIEYDLSDLLDVGQVPGTFDVDNSLGRVILEKDLMKFESILSRGEYFIKEKVIIDNNYEGYVENWNPINGFLSVSGLSGEIETGQYIRGENSFATGAISKIFKSDLYFELSSSTKISKNWEKESGFLNNDIQKIQDSLYYQNFSYSLKSKVDYDTWKDAVMTLNHPRGFKGFADYQLESENFVGISTQQIQSIVDPLVDIISVSDLNTYYNFDTASETSIQINSSIASKEILFDNKILEDHVLSVGNRVLSIDNISWEFDSTENTEKRNFELTSNGLPIFKREFDASDSNIINLSSDTIKIENHFFVTGEKVYYSNNTNSSSNSIGIGTTDFGVGIGLTDKLPNEVYIVKISDNLIKLSRTATESLKSIPDTLNITSVGIGTTHFFSSFNQNSRVLISIDNIIQSPIVSTAVTSNLSQNLTGTSSSIYINNISKFFNGDLVKINNEIVKINSVGVGSTNVLNVSRSWMGTISTNHSAGDLVTKHIGNYNIIENTINFASPPYGEYSIDPFERDVNSNLLLEKSNFHGRSFIKSGYPNQNSSTYSNNYIFDDISTDFSGISSNFILKTSSTNVTGISSDNIIMLVNNIMQIPSYTSNNISETNNYTLLENSGITSIYFSGSSNIPNPEDINTSSLPRKGIIVSIGSSKGFGYQPLISAGGTSIVSSAGTIQSISIGNSGSGYRSGIQTVVNVGVKTEDLEYANVHYVGTASISNGHVVGVSITNPGIGYTSSNPPIVVFDAPLSYTNLPLVYSTSSGSSGLGTESKIDIIVGNGSSVIEYEIKNFGYNYNVGDVLTISIGGATGIPTDTSKSFEEFKVFVEQIKNDNFSGWFVGKLQPIDDITNSFNGEKRSFPLTVSDDDTFILYKQKGSKIDLNYNILVFLNDVLQIPYESYEISPSGSRIIFSEAPKGRSEDDSESGDNCKILFYMGNSEYDTVITNIIETVKTGDRLTLGYDPNLNQTYALQEEERTVESLNLSSAITLPYFGVGIREDISRPVSWSLQTKDLIINSEEVSKSRLLYEPTIQPVSYLISPIGIGSSSIFVDNIRPFFNAKNESNSLNYNFQNKITIVSQEVKEPGLATATVSTSGTVSSVSITDGGFGYTSNPTITFESPVGLGTTARATATSSVLSGVITQINITNGGIGYTSSNPPHILIEPPVLKTETNDVTNYSGDYGIISGISTGSIVGVASTAIVFDLFIPSDSYLRNSSLTGISGITTVSGMQPGYYFVVHNSNIGNGVTSIDSSGSIVGVGTTYLDNVYRAVSVSYATSYVPMEGLRPVIKVVVSVSSFNGLTGLGFSNFYGEYSWGKIDLNGRQKNNEYVAETLKGVVGLSTGTIIRRTNQLKYSDYSS